MKIEEKALVTNRCKTLSDLISNLLWIEDKFGEDISVGNIPTLNPSIELNVYNNGGKPIVILN